VEHQLQTNKDYPSADITRKIIGCAFEVHRELGAGYLEKVYVSALAHELAANGLQAAHESPIEVTYKGKIIGKFFADLLVENEVICEIKAVQRLAPEHEAQLLNYLKGTSKKIGLLINFGARSVQIRRMVF
jgi:GxxExxY protein